MQNALRFFCLLDAFSLSDTHIAWKRCKVLSITIILSAGFILIIIGGICLGKLLVNNISKLFWVKLIGNFDWQSVIGTQYW